MVSAVTAAAPGTANTTGSKSRCTSPSPHRRPAPRGSCESARAALLDASTSLWSRNPSGQFTIVPYSSGCTSRNWVSAPWRSAKKRRRRGKIWLRRASTTRRRSRLIICSLWVSTTHRALPTRSYPQKKSASSACALGCRCSSGCSKMSVLPAGASSACTSVGNTWLTPTPTLFGSRLMGRPGLLTVHPEARLWASPPCPLNPPAPAAAAGRQPPRSGRLL